MVSFNFDDYIEQFRESPNKAIEKINSELLKEKDEENRAKLLTIISSLYILLGDYQQALNTAKQALDLSRKIKNLNLELKSFLLIADSYVFQHKIDIAEQNVELIEIIIDSSELKKDSKNYTELSAYLNKIKGNIHFQKRNFEQANVFYNISRELYGKLNNKTEEAKILSNLGVVNQEVGRFDQAIELLNQAKNINEKNNNDRGIAICLNNIGEIYRLQNKYDEAIRHYSRVLQIGEKLQSKSFLFLGNFNLGLTKFAMKDFTEAKEHFERSVNLSKEIGNYTDLALSSFYLGRILLKKSKSSKLFSFIHEVEEYVSMYNSNDLEISYLILIALYKLNGTERIERCRANAIFYDVFEKQTNEVEFIFFISLHLLKFVFEELYYFEEESIIDEISRLFDRLLEKFNERENLISGLSIVISYLHFLAIINEKKTLSTYYNTIIEILQTRNLTIFKEKVEAYWKKIQKQIEDKNWINYSFKERMDKLKILNTINETIENFI